MSRHHDIDIHHSLHSAPMGMWECPDLFPVAAERVRHVRDRRQVKNSQLDYYTIGMYGTQMDQYVPDGPNDNKLYRQYDYGNFYKSKTFYDPMKRRCVLWGWAKESDNKAKGWAGIYVCAVAAPQSMDQSAALSMFGTSHHEP
jgi:beta-fructofuranosidase